MTGGLGDLEGHRAGQGVDLLRPGAVGVAAALGRALIVTGAQEALALDPHGKIEQPGENRRHVLTAAFDQLFHQGFDNTILVFPHNGSPWLIGLFHGKPR